VGRLKKLGMGVTEDLNGLELAMEHDPVVFISSTSDDLKAHREQAAKAALASGFSPRMMEYFPASGHAPSLQAGFRQPNQLSHAHRLGLWHALSQRRDPVVAAFVIQVQVRPLFRFLDETSIQHAADRPVQRSRAEIERAAGHAPSQKFEITSTRPNSETYRRSIIAVLNFPTQPRARRMKAAPWLLLSH